MIRNRVMPFGIKQYNSNEPCDMLVGPCCCGAWHRLRDWPKAMLRFIREKAKVDERRKQ